MKINKKVKEYHKELNRLTVEGGPVNTVVIDPNWYTNLLKEQQEKENLARKAEQQRVNKLKCPVCCSTKKAFHSKGHDNNIYGPGYHYTETDSYYVCQECGIMFKDLNKPQKSGRLR